MKLAGRVAVVTGGAGGLGGAIALGAAEAGAAVAILDVKGVDEAVAHLHARGFKAAGRVVDVRDGQAVKAAIEALSAELGAIDTLIAAAGGSLGTPRDLDDISEADLDLVLDVNIKGTFHCARAVLPFMRQAGRGAIVTFSSIGGRSASPVTGVPYAAAKAGLLGLTRRLAKEVGGENIRVNAIAPGLFLTDRLQGMFDALPEADRREVLDSIPLGRMPSIQECVDPVLFLASDESSYITGVVLDVNGGRFMAG
ncbi:MAG: SDR family oxidoreductase [Actinobacteria bacterium]|nr:SDR family oxidoreductase [Actinomycetota bacterium]